LLIDSSRRLCHSRTKPPQEELKGGRKYGISYPRQKSKKRRKETEKQKRQECALTFPLNSEIIFSFLYLNFQTTSKQ